MVSRAEWAIICNSYRFLFPAAAADPIDAAFLASALGTLEALVVAVVGIRESKPPNIPPPPPASLALFEPLEA